MPVITGKQPLPAQFWAVWTATLINRAGGFVIIFLAIYLTSQRGFSETTAGLVIGLYGLGGAIGVTAGGHLTDRWGRRPTALLALGSASALMIVLGLVRGEIAIMVAAGLLGLAAEAARPALGAMITDIVPDADRMRAFNIYFWAINLGFAVAAVLAGFASSAGYFWLFAADAATTAFAAVLIAVKTRETRPAHLEAKHEGGSLAAVAKDRVFLGFIACNLLIALVLLQHMSMLPLAMVDDELPPSTFGVVIALNGILIVVGQLGLTRLLIRRRPAYILPVSAAVIGLGFGLTAFAHTPVWYGATVLVWTLGEMLNAPANSALLAGLSPVAMRGRYQGGYSLSWQLASFLAPTLGGAVRDHADNTTLWLGCLGLGVAAGVWSLLSAPARERRVEALAAEEREAGLVKI
ncbi:MFS transporter [Dactylosporangium sp. AC04546]|uniref:MDR family MFS transporter n=1 Tax=Dactylosporangium sp. AC04546 TaxID=2862460 RepID=UPI001EDDA25F|nr:MFS transporter [Dactylosporangium sp. AC04546]WVK84549.1 MFS transporter [Dactylosporangium sp. AC04546]